MHHNCLQKLKRRVKGLLSDSVFSENQKVGENPEKGKDD